MMQEEFHKWHDCYDDSWKDLIVDEAFCHPAKFARGLIERIVRHGLAHGYWKAGDIIGDPFAGVALGGIICGYHGLSWLGIELEEKFVSLGRQNLDLHREKIKALGYDDVTLEIRQGDSRQFAALVDGICTSAPWAQTSNQAIPGKNRDVKNHLADCNCNFCRKNQRNAGIKQGNLDYGTTPGQIGRLPAGSVDGVLTSPPYAEGLGHGGEPTRGAGRSDDSNFDGMQNGYGTSPGNIGNLKAGRLDGICTSPPFEDSAGSTDKGFRAHGLAEHAGKWAQGRSRESIERLTGDYGRTAGQIGNTSGETYWQAVAQCYSRCRQCLKPGGILCVVVKDYVKNGQRIPLCDDTLRLLVSLGFEPVERIHAMLVKHTSEAHLFEGQVKKRKERKSFFRRNYEKQKAAEIYWPEIENQEEFLQQARILKPKAKQKQIVKKAQIFAYEAAGEPYIEFDTRIDYEEVLFVRAGQMGLFQEK